MIEDFKELEKFLKDKGYTPKVNSLDGTVVFTNIHSTTKGNSIKLRMVIRVSFGAVFIEDEKGE